MTKQLWQEIANKYAANQNLLDSLGEEKSKALSELQDAVQDVLWMIAECHDLHLSDVRKLQQASWGFDKAFECEPSDHQLEQFAEYDIEWPVKKKTKGK